MSEGFKIKLLTLYVVKIAVYKNVIKGVGFLHANT